LEVKSVLQNDKNISISSIGMIRFIGTSSTITINLQPNPSPLTAEVSLHSASCSTTLRVNFDCPLTSSRHGPRTGRTPYQRKMCLRCPATNYLPRICLRGNVFTDTLPSNGRPIVATRLSGKAFMAPLPSSEYTR
jgi:hypothetical protein